MTSEQVRIALRRAGLFLLWLARLSVEAAGYLWRTSLDAAAQLQLLNVWRKARRIPEGTEVIKARREAMRARRDARWSGWRSTPVKRQFQVRFAAAALTLAALLIARAYIVDRFASRPAAETLDDSTTTDSTPQEETHKATAMTAADFRRAVDAAERGTWVVDTSVPTLAPGRLGAWDDFKVGSPVVLEEPGRLGFGARYHMWYRGCHFLEEYSCAVGHASSKDGVEWTRDEQPVFVPPDRIDREHLDAIALARSSSGYVMWYAVSPSWPDGRRRAVIYAAASTDGVKWTPKAVVYTAAVDGARLFPAGLWDGTRFHVWLIDSRAPIDPTTGRFPTMSEEGDEALLHFTSVDGVRLDAAGATPVGAMPMPRVPLLVVRDDSGGFRMFYYDRFPRGGNSQGVAVLRSADGSVWERSDADRMPLSISGLGAGMVRGTLALIPREGGVMAWLVHVDNRGLEDVRTAFFKGRPQ